MNDKLSHDIESYFQSRFQVYSFDGAGMYIVKYCKNENQLLQIGRIAI